jgi:hypothetical protein
LCALGPGYQYLKSLDIGYWFYTGSYLEAIEEVLNPALKTIVHIPSVNSSASTTDKHEEVGAILSILGEWTGRDEKTDFHLVRQRDAAFHCRRSLLASPSRLAGCWE